MHPLRYSLRDLRSTFYTQTLQKDFFGDYDYTARRWRFSSAESCKEAQAFLDGTELHTLHAPGASKLVDGIRSRGGFSVLARNEDGANKHGTAFYLFKSAEDRFETSKFLYGQLAANDTVLRQVQEALASAPADLFAGTSPGAITEGFGTRKPWTHEAQKTLARVLAGSATRPRSTTDEELSRAQARELAAQFLETDFEAEAAPANGEAVGILVARSAHHLAVQTDESGRGVILDRWRVATPLRQQYPVERAFDVGSAIHVRLVDGAGDALQIRGERDLAYGSLLLKALREAQNEGTLPIVQTEDLGFDDVRGKLVALDATLGVVLDRGAYLTVARTQDLHLKGFNTSVAVGPTYGDQRSVQSHLARGSR